MSHPDEPMPAPPVPNASLEGAPAAPAAPPAAAAPGGAPPTVVVAQDPTALEAVPSGAPYRVPAPPPALEPMTPEIYFGAPPRKPRPLIGPALSVFAVMLWSFVVAGQFASSWSLGIQVRNGEAFFVVVSLTFVAWIANMRRSRISVPPRAVTHLVWRSIGAGIVAFILFFFCLVAATAINSAMNADLLVASVLVLLSLLAAIGGAHLTSPVAFERTPRQRTILIALWVAGTLLTLVAGADLGAHG